MRNPSISITRNHIIPFSPYHHNPNEVSPSLSLLHATQTLICHEIVLGSVMPTTKKPSRTLKLL